MLDKTKKKPEPDIKSVYTFFKNGIEYQIEARDEKEAREQLFKLIDEKE